MKEILYKKNIYKEKIIKINNKDVKVVFKYLRPNKIEKIKNKYIKEVDKKIAEYKIIITILSKSIQSINGVELEKLCNEKCKKSKRKIKVIENLSQKAIDKLFDAYNEISKEIDALADDEISINNIVDNNINKLRFKLSILMGLPYNSEYFNSLTLFEWLCYNKLLEDYEKSMYIYHRSLLEYAMSFVAPQAVKEHIRDREVRESLENKELTQIVFNQIKNLDKLQEVINKGRSNNGNKI